MVLPHIATKFRLENSEKLNFKSTYSYRNFRNGNHHRFETSFNSSTRKVGLSFRTHVSTKFANFHRVKFWTSRIRFNETFDMCHYEFSSSQFIDYRLHSQIKRSQLLPINPFVYIFLCITPTNGEANEYLIFHAKKSPGGPPIVIALIKNHTGSFFIWKNHRSPAHLKPSQFSRTCRFFAPRTINTDRFSVREWHWKMSVWSRDIDRHTRCCPGSTFQFSIFNSTRRAGFSRAERFAEVQDRAPNLEPHTFASAWMMQL